MFYQDMARIVLKAYGKVYPYTINYPKLRLYKYD